MNANDWKPWAEKSIPKKEQVILCAWGPWGGMAYEVMIHWPESRQVRHREVARHTAIDIFPLE